MKLPPGYAPVEGPGARGFAIPAAVPWLAEVLGSASTVHAWARSNDAGLELAGRGRVHAVPAPVSGPDGRSHWAVRHYRRGGAMAPLLGDRYLRLGRRRTLSETEASVAARARGVRTPPVVAGAVYPSGPFYRADLVTELVPDAPDLAEVLFRSNPPETDRARVLASVGRFIRTLEAAGVEHGDLNAKNLLVVLGGSAPVTHLVDLDGCRVRTPGSADGAAMLRRLERSLRKLERAYGTEVGPGPWGALRSGFRDAT